MSSIQPEYTPISTNYIDENEIETDIDNQNNNNQNIELTDLNYITINFFFADSTKKEFYTNLDVTINQLKQTAFEEFYNTSNIRMIFHGRAIEDQQTLRQCNITQNDCNIHVTITDREVPLPVAQDNNNNSAFDNFSILMPNNDNDVHYGDQSLSEGTRGDFMCGNLFLLLIVFIFNSFYLWFYCITIYVYRYMATYS